MSKAEITLVKIKRALLEAEEKASDIYAPILAEIWHIIREAEKDDAVEKGSQARLEGL